MYLAVEVLRDHVTDRPTAVDSALAELDSVYAYLFARVGNASDAEDLTQEVALKALPRLRDGAGTPEIRGYLFATARSVLGGFWSQRLRLPVSELPDEVLDRDHGSELTPPAQSAARLMQVLSCLSASHRQVLELRFLRGYSLRETAAEMGKSVGGVKVMQFRALRKAAEVSASSQ